jgi:hypothetical protein
MSNGLCSSDLTGHLTRGACTDASFASPCVTACNDGELLITNGKVNRN